MGKPAHRVGPYQSQARAVCAAANANPLTLCWRCGLMLHQHGPHKNGRKPFWTAGHVIDADPLSPLLPEASTCNFRAGGQRGATIANGAVRGTRRW